MVEDGKKAAVALGLIAAVGGIVLATRAKAAPPPGEGAAIEIIVLGPDGEPIPHNSPIELEEGTVGYSVALMITNLSTKGGTAWEADLDVAIIASTANYVLVPTQRTLEHFLAEETRTFVYPLTIPMGSGGESGQILARVFDPLDNLLAEDLEPVNIISMAIIYAATVSIAGIT